ncbi:MAG: gliding motility-associated C-terminal domain-containing protein [Bacteroidia bacterium]
MKSFSNYFLFIFYLLSNSLFAQRGKDGNVTINTFNRIVNEYATLTADASVGDNILTVSASGLNTNNRFASTLTSGDLIMIIQMQGATILGAPDTTYPIFSNPDNATWGSITNYNNCGNYELAQIAQVSSNTSIIIDCGLKHNYTATGKVQIVRIPRYNTLTINSPGVLTCEAWNGSIGGVLAVEVKGDVTINSGAKINANGKGFRGAALYTPSPSRSQFPWFSSISTEMSANKGEGIAGSGNDLVPYGGQYGRGAAANAGGAGNVWNCGGGGGGNAGPINLYTGMGNPDVTNSNWATAWDLEYVGFSSTISSGGGRGGYSFSANDENALVNPPDDIIWGGYARRNFGGMGGRPLDYSTGRIFMGGGGGGGEQDNNQGGAGGNGGGIIHITSYGAITGTGNDSILADGNNGGDSYVSPPLTSYSGKDGAGGGGAGGTIIIHSYNTAGLVLSAQGARGGDQRLTSGSLYFGEKNEAEGPGGGGGGGYIALSAGNPIQLVNGGRNGVTNSDGMTEFPPNGATKGGAGLSNQSLPIVDSLYVNAITICAGDSVDLVAYMNASPAQNISWFDALVGGNNIGTDTLFTTALYSDTVFYAGQCPGNYRVALAVTVLPSDASISITSTLGSAICPGTSVNFSSVTVNADSVASYNWFVNGTLTGIDSVGFVSSTLQQGDSVLCMLVPTSGCAAGDTAFSNTLVIQVLPTLVASINISSSPNDTICAQTPVTFSANPVNEGNTPVYQWQLNGVNVGTNSPTYTNALLNNGDIVTCILTSNANCVTASPATSNSIEITVNALPQPNIVSDITSGCHLPLCVQFNETSGIQYTQLTYDFGDGNTANTAVAQNCFTQAGNYSVAITVVDSNNCIATNVVSNMVVISETPTANFTITPTTDIVANTQVLFTNTSINTNAVAWDFGDSLSSGNTSIANTPQYSYPQGGSFCIRLIAFNQAGCTDTLIQCINVSNQPLINIPNIFTPNGDGNNDVFFITTQSITKLSCTIFNRWGIKVTEWTDINANWDGKIADGKLANDGVYFYIVNAQATDGSEIVEKGYLQLLTN